MTHLDANDIGKLIDGTISKKERAVFNDHLAECDHCRSIYSETVKAMDEEKDNILPLTSRPVKTVITWKVALAATLAIIAVLLGFFIWNKGANKESGPILMAQIDAIATQRDNLSLHTFSPSKNIRISAVRIGILVEDLSRLTRYGQRDALCYKLIRVLNKELKQITNGSKDLISSYDKLDYSTFEDVSQQIVQIMANRQITPFFQFGRFLENSWLSTYANIYPKNEDLRKYQHIIRESEFAAEIGGKLKELEQEAGIGKKRDGLLNIIMIFLM